MPLVAEPKRRNTLPQGVIPVTERHSRVYRRAPSSAPSAGPVTGVRPVPRSDDGLDQVTLLVDELMLCTTPRAAAPIVRRLFPFGRTTMSALAERFPGRLWQGPQPRGRLPKPIELSAVCGALAAFGLEAVPYLHGLLKDSEADVRRYAAVLCAEVRHPDLLNALVNNAVDPDRQCRKVSIHVLSTYRNDEEWSGVTAKLRAWAQSETESTRVRRLAVSALTQLRDVPSLEILVDLLSSDDRSVATASRIGLRILTAHDFGFARATWVRWIATHGTSDRTEWLIDALADSRPEIRSLAATELARIAPAVTPLPRDPTQAAVTSAQLRYQAWWKQQSAALGIYQRSDEPA